MIRKTRFSITLAVLCLLFFSQCASHTSRGHANDHMHHKSVKELAAQFDDPQRDEWQKSDWVIDQISKSKNYAVWEIGAGSGFFSFKMAKKGWQVTAADPNPEFISLMEEKKLNLSIPEKMRLKTKLTTYDQPSIPKGAVDAVFLSNVYHHIENRVAYFKLVKESMKKNAKLVIVDFEEGKGGYGPPDSMRVSSSKCRRELEEAGFKKFSVNQSELPYQYLLTAE